MGTVIGRLKASIYQNSPSLIRHLLDICSAILRGQGDLGRFHLYCLRHLFTQAVHRGKPRVECPLCNWKGWSFREYWAFHGSRVIYRSTEERICPRCYSKARYRLYLLHFQRSTWAQSRKRLKVLDCSSPNTFHSALKKVIDTSFIITSDLLIGCHVQNDLTACAFKDGSFDIVVCSHILEHIPRYLAALTEIHRILHENGRAILQTPVNPNLPETIEFDESNAELCGHVREFGRDFYAHVFGVGFRIAPDAISFMNTLSKEEIDRFGLVIEAGQPLTVCMKI